MQDLFKWARGIPNVHIVELGVRTGNSTSAFLAALEVHRSGNLWSIDIADPQVPDEWFELPYWSFLKADALSPEAMDWAPKTIDVLFIDLDPHSYEQTFAALSMWAPRVAPGGVILLHDTEYPQVDNRGSDAPVAAELPPIDSKWTPRDEWPVSRAVDHYCRLKGLEWRNKSGCFGLGIVRPR